MKHDGAVGVGTDLVEVDEIRSALERQPGLRDRLFTNGEWAYATRHADPLPHLAARFAAKEAVMKALGGGIGSMSFTDIEIVRDDSGKPSVLLSGRAAELAQTQGISGWLISLTHTRRLAHAMAVGCSRE